jgi:hypothetical protein
MSFEQMVEKGYVIVGSPDQVAEKTIEMAKQLHIGHVMSLCHFGNMSRDLAMHNTELMATKVLPQIRHLWDEEWDDEWWPTPLPSSQRMTPSPFPATPR